MLAARSPITAVGPPMSQSDHRKLKRFNLPGQARELTFSCFKRRPYLSSDRAKEWVVEAVQRARETHGFQLWAWVIMPEHVHLLVLPERDQPDVGPILSTIKQSVSRVALDWVRSHDPEQLEIFADRAPSGKVSYRIWQRGAGYDRSLYSPKAIWNGIEYIHMNPVRRGLCPTPLDWEWSSARSLLRRGESRIELNRASLPAKGAW